jgi:tryptophan synthase alpha subunit
MTRILAKFRSLKRQDRNAFIPYYRGDPSLEATDQILLELERSGADI